MDAGLFIAVKERNCDKVSDLNKANPQILRTTTPLGNTALHIAAIRKDHKLAQLLLSLKPCIVLMRNVMKETALHKAAAAGCLKVVKLLLNFSNQVRCNCSECAQPSESCDLEEGRLVPNDFWAAKNVHKETALHYAARGGYVEIVKVLLDKVEGIARILNKDGESALYTACHERGYLRELVEMLEEKVGISDTRQEKETYLHQLISIECDHLSSGNVKDTWQHILFVSSVDICKTSLYVSDEESVALYLLGKRPYLAEKADASGNVPLHLASIAGCPKLVEKLLDVSPGMALRKNNDEMAAIHIAARMGHENIVKCLINSVPECTEVLGKDNKNALHFALEYGNVQLAKTLLLQSIDPSFLINHADNYGQTAFHKVAQNDELEEVLRTMFRISSWNVNAVDNDGLAALDIVEFKVGAVLKPYYRWKLRRYGGHRSVWINLMLQRLLGRPTEMDSEIQNKPEDNLSIVATLIFTATFAAAFTVPGGVRNDNGIPVWMHAVAFKCFIVSDTLAFCFSILAMLFLAAPKKNVLSGYGRVGPFIVRIGFNRGALTLKVGNILVSASGVLILYHAINATMVSFIMGVYVTVAPKCLSLALTVNAIGAFSFLLYNPQFILYFQNVYSGIKRHVT